MTQIPTWLAAAVEAAGMTAYADDCSPAVLATPKIESASPDSAHPPSGE